MSRITRSQIDEIRATLLGGRVAEADEAERGFARAVAEEVGEIVADSGSPSAAIDDPLEARVRARLGVLSALARERVVARAGSAATTRTVAVGAGGRHAAPVQRRTRRSVMRDATLGRAAAPGAPVEGLDFDGQVRRLVRRRLEAARPRMEAEIGRVLRGVGSGRTAAQISRTRVDLRLASSEGLDTWRREINFSSIEQLEFRWNSEESGTARGHWELRGPVTPGHEGDLIASGDLPDGLSGAAVGGYFSIPLREHLPPKPPQQAAEYHVRVLPVGASRRAAVVADPGRRVLSPVDPSAGRSAPEGVGLWSPPAVIRYGQEFETPLTEFTIENVSVYKRARFSLDWFRIVTDQVGLGAEEFHVSGFIIQHSPQGAHVPVRIGPYSFTIDEDDRSRRRFGQQATFYLGTPNRTYWPRTFTAVLSVMEEDDGGALADWQAAVAEIAEDMMRDPAAAELSAFLDEMRERIAEMQAEIAAEMAAEMAALISALIASVSKEIISAAIAVVVAWIAAHIRSGAEDDFYGVRVYGLCLCTSDVRRLADGTAGDLFSNGPFASGGRFEGSERPDGSFRLQETELQFTGLGGALEGSPSSGVVNMGLHWEFFDRVDV